MIIEAMESMQWGRRWDGTGSIKHVDFDENKINFLILSTDTSLGDENEGGGLSGNENWFK